MIRYRSGKTKYVGGIVALTLASILLLLAVQIQSNFNYLLNGQQNRDSVANFLVVNKQLTDATIGKTNLDSTTITGLKKQPFIQAIGLLEGSRFKASIESKSSRFPFYTDISFESTPAEFIDVQNNKWEWTEESDYVPVIVPNQFLDLYNFQFSLSQGLPQLTPELVKMIVFTITIYGNGNQMSFNGKVVGFSNRISSMLVPPSFMNWGNTHFATSLDKSPSRVIIKTNDPSNPQLTDYLKTNNLITDTEKTRFSKYRKIVEITVVILSASGLLLLLFSLLIFSLFINLTISSCQPEIVLLLTLGSSPAMLSKFLLRKFFIPCCMMILLALSVIAVIQFFSHNSLAHQQIILPVTISAYTLITALLLLVLLWIVNKKSIKGSMQTRNNLLQ